MMTLVAFINLVAIWFLWAIIKRKNNLLEEAWGVIANAHCGNWDDATISWRVSASRWRDTYFAEVVGNPYKPVATFSRDNQ